jgi:hypothetical protein
MGTIFLRMEARDNGSAWDGQSRSATPISDLQIG